MLNDDLKHLYRSSTVHDQAFPVSRYGGNDTPPSCVVFHIALSPNQRGRRNWKRRGR